jgi:alpha-glucosidase (family GH31 glycosyl hydrolase)
MRRCIQTRLKILPYLEGLFAIHGAFGDPVLRPLCYEFPQKDYARTDDQFLVGPSVMMAPFLDPSEKSRTVLIPPGWWLDLGTGNWMEGPSTIRVERPTPARPMIYVRDGTILPAWQGTEFPADGEGTGLLDLHVVLWEATRATGLLVEDDGISLDGPVSWRDLAYTRDGSSGKLTAIARSLGYGKVSSSARLVFHGWAPEGASSEEDLWPFHGRRLPCQSVVLPG